MTDERRVARATFRKAVSDGAYGSEFAEVTVEQDYNPDVEDEETVASGLLATARRLVENELGHSKNGRIRSTVGAKTVGVVAAQRQPPRSPLIEVLGDDDGEE